MFSMLQKPVQEEAQADHTAACKAPAKKTLTLVKMVLNEGEVPQAKVLGAPLFNWYGRFGSET